MEFKPDNRIPAVEVTTITGDTMVLSWINTVIRTYKQDTYNHIEVFTGEGKVGFITPQSVMDHLFELDFPYTFNPAVDRATKDWYVGVMTDGLDDEIRGLLD